MIINPLMIISASLLFYYTNSKFDVSRAHSHIWFTHKTIEDTQNLKQQFLLYVVVTRQAHWRENSLSLSLQSLIIGGGVAVTKVVSTQSRGFF